MKYLWPLLGVVGALLFIFWLETSGRKLPLPIPLASAASAVPSVRPYLTPQVEAYMARDQCTIIKQRCRKDDVCETCMACPDNNGRQLAGWAATKCKSPTDCVLLETNVDWEREKTDPGWCEGVQDGK